MYPTVYHAIKDLFGVEISFLQIANTFGFFVAIAFLVGNYVMTLELKRKEKEGLVLPSSKLVKIGTPYPLSDYISNALIGFIFGYKILPIIFDSHLLSNGAQSYIFSLNGNWFIGFGLSGLMLFLKWREDKKQRLEEPIEQLVVVHPWQHMGYITLAAAITGIMGAKIFHWFEYWDDFIAHPLELIFSASGLTFFGGLLCGGAGVIWAAKRKGIGFKTIVDVGGPALMLAYGIGRLGCHFSGDGDWGIINTAPKPSWFSIFPDWLWTYNYPNNVSQECDPTGGSMPCDFATTPFLQLPVFPTPLYEAFAAFALFLILWVIRKKIKTAGVLFGIYLMMVGVERFLIEQIRVNSTYSILGYHPTQAELIACVLILLGIALCITRYTKTQKTTQADFIS